MNDNEALGHIPNVISCETQGAALRSESARLTFFPHPLIKHKKHLQNLQLQHPSWFFFYIGVTTKTKVHCTQGLYPFSETNFQDSDWFFKGSKSHINPCTPKILMLIPLTAFHTLRMFFWVKQVSKTFQDQWPFSRTFQSWKMPE